MIAPSFHGGHEGTRPVRVDGAEVGDAVAIHIRDVDVTSMATSTGSIAERTEAFRDDPFVDHHCPECGASASSFGFEYGYTVAFDRAADLFDMSEGELRARCTFTGGVQVGRLPGVVQLDVLAPLALLEARGLGDLARDQYGH